MKFIVKVEFDAEALPVYIQEIDHNKLMMVGSRNRATVFNRITSKRVMKFVSLYYGELGKIKREKVTKNGCKL